MKSMLDRGIEKIGKDDYKRVMRWIKYSEERFKDDSPRDRERKALLLLDDQEMEPGTATFVVWCFGVGETDIPKDNLADRRTCDYLSLLLEQRLKLKVEYNARLGRLYVTEVLKARERDEGFRDLLENTPRICDVRSADYDPVSGEGKPISEQYSPTLGGGEQGI